MAGALDLSLGIALPLGYGRVRGTGKQVINQTLVAAAPQLQHYYNLGDVISDSTNLQQCTAPGLSGTSLPPWSHYPSGPTTWGGTTWENQGTTNGGGYQYGLWLLGEGEWDGFDTIWNAVGDNFVAGAGYSIPSGSYNAGPSVLNPPLIRFHSGSDGGLGPVLSPFSTGPDQGPDEWISELPPGAAIVNQNYSRQAYYMMKWLPKHIYAPTWNVDQTGQVMAPIGDWRALRCRIFDDQGNEVGYQWTQNPAWHFVDACLRCCLFPRSEFNLRLSGTPPNIITTPTPVPTWAKDHFDWGSVYEFSQDCDYLLANGRKRFEGNYLFGAATPLSAILEQILLCSKGYVQESAGKLFLSMDKPRASSFTVKNRHYIPGSLKVDQAEVDQNANSYSYQFLDTLLAAVTPVASITFTAGDPQGPYEISTGTALSPCAPWDYIEVGGNTVADMNNLYQVNNIIDAYAFKASTSGPDPANGTVGTGGYIGYPQARFSQRYAGLIHYSHAMARGQIGPGTGSTLLYELVSQSMNFSSCPWDQANRLALYEMCRANGFDVAVDSQGHHVGMLSAFLAGLYPELLGTLWKPPVTLSIDVWAESVDDAWNILKTPDPTGNSGVAWCGRVITIDPEIIPEWAGEYELLAATYSPFDVDAGAIETMGGSGSGGSGSQVQLTLTLRTYDARWLSLDTSMEASYVSLPLPIIGDEG